jgi:hypothetical protein
MWTLAIAEGISPHAQLQLLSDGLLDVVFDSVSRTLLVRVGAQTPSCNLLQCFVFRKLSLVLAVFALTHKLFAKWSIHNFESCFVLSMTHSMV